VGAGLKFGLGPLYVSKSFRRRKRRKLTQAEQLIVLAVVVPIGLSAVMGVWALIPAAVLLVAVPVMLARQRR
jgi:hypothetical protein